MKNPILVVVESPSKAKTISKYLGKNYIVRPTFGHVYDLVKGKGARSLGIDIEDSYKPKYRIIPDKKDKLKALESAAKTASQVYLAADPDREGEAIAHHILDYLKRKKITVPVKRVLFHEITKKGIDEGIKNTRDLDDNLYHSQQARRVLDRIVGFMVSPYLMNYFKEEDKLSAGRVQSVALRLIVDREKEIRAFTPEEYWIVSATLSKNNKKFVAKYTDKIKNKNEAKDLKKELEYDKFFVEDVDAYEKKKAPNPPFTTSTLQQVASTRLKFSASRTMKVAQSLYEKGLVTYIRTDSIRSSKDAMKEARIWLSNNNYKLPENPNNYKTKNNAQDGHEAIRPTDVNVKANGSTDEVKLYDLIWERFISSQMTPAVYNMVDASIKTKKGYNLKTNGRSIKDKGFLNVWKEKVSKKDKDIKIPSLEKGDNLKLESPGIEAEQKFTQPPSRYNQGSLIKELEKKGIGRPSTYANILTKISDRKYVKMSNNTYSSTPLGEKVCDLLSSYFSFLNYNYTAKMENQLDKIASGNLEYHNMMEGFFSSFKEELINAKGVLYKSAERKCKKCGKEMIIKHGAYGYFAACPAYPKCKSTEGIEFDGEKIITKKERKIQKGTSCPKCGKVMFRRDGKWGPFLSCSEFPKCTGKSKIPFKNRICSKCNENKMYVLAYKGELKLACMGYPDCKNIEEIPEGEKVDWKNPNDLMPKKMSKKVEDFLKK